MRKNQWLLLLAALALAWCASMGLFLAGAFSYPWGWLVLLVLIGWTWFKAREGDA